MMPMSDAALGVLSGLWAISTPRPPELREQNESIEQIEGYLTRPNSARALRRSNTNGRRECTDQVRAKELGKHQGTAPRARSGGLISGQKTTKSWVFWVDHTDTRLSIAGRDHA